jgi:glycosyltransferase involved in cell wall biosynthesis
MKAVCQVVPHYVPAVKFGGVVKVGHAISRELHARGIRVTVVTSNLKDAASFLPRLSGKSVRVDGVDVYYERVMGSKYWGFAPFAILRLWREIGAADLTLLHFHYQFLTLLGAWVARLRRRPYIVFTHGSLRRESIGARGTARKSFYLRFFEMANLRRAKLVVFNSEEEQAASIALNNAVVIGNGVARDDLSSSPRGTFRGRHNIADDECVFLFLGRIAEGKGIPLLLRAFASEFSKADKCRLVIVGAGERGYDREIDALAKELQIEERVFRPGFLEGEDKFSALQDADVYVLPSQGEGLSMAMLEAMYALLPVIVTPSVGLAARIEKLGCGIVVDNDVRSLAAAMRRLHDSPTERREMGQAARVVVDREFTWPAIVDTLLERSGMWESL